MVIGKDSGSCDVHRIGSTVTIRYLEADPHVTQIVQPMPWAVPLVVGLVLLSVEPVRYFVEVCLRVRGALR